MDRQQISQSDLSFLFTGFIIGTAIMLMPSAEVSEARQDGWLALLIGMLPSLVLIGLIVSLQRRFPGQSIIQYSVTVCGYPVGKAIGALVLWFALHLSALVLRNLDDFIETLILPLTPAVIIAALIIVIAAYAVIGGIEVIARITIVLVPPLVLFVLILSMLTIHKTELARLLPFLENGFLPVVRGAILTASFPFGETVLLAMVIFHVKQEGGSKRVLLYSIIIGAFLLDIGVFRSITVLSVAGATRYIYPVFEASREAPSSNVLEVLLTIDWFVFGFIKLVLCYYAFVFGLAQWVGSKDYRRYVLPAGIIIVALSLLVYSNYSEEIFFASKIWPVYAIPIEYGIPFLLWIVAKARNKILTRTSAKDNPT